MSTLQFQSLRLENFRCFEDLSLSFEPDLTVLFAENASGKTAILTAAAMGLDQLQPSHSRHTTPKQTDVRKVSGAGANREPAGPCTMTWTGRFGDRNDVTWSGRIPPTSSRTKFELTKAQEGVESVRRKGERWPLVAYYGTARFAQERKTSRRKEDHQDRWGGYTGALDPSPTNDILLSWLKREAYGDLTRIRRKEAERRFDLAVFNTIQRATPGIAEAYYDPAIESPMIRFKKWGIGPWDELSDGYHMYISLLADIARRAVMLNDIDGPEAPLLVEGVVLIDEIDLHLHPRWQRRVLESLRTAFPKLQFIVTTHSPQVLSSALNRQVRHLVDRRLKTGTVFVEGRDSNAILRDLMNTDERDPRGMKALKSLYDALDADDMDAAKSQLAALRDKWGDRDPDLIRAQAFIDEEET